MAYYASAVSVPITARRRPFLAEPSNYTVQISPSAGRRPAQLARTCHCATGSTAAQSDPEGPDHYQAANPTGQDDSLSAASTSSPGKSSNTFVQGFRNFFGGDKMDMQRLKALGLGAVASYGCVSNVTYGTGLAISWITFVRQTGKSPLMANQWKPFLALYGGFWAAQHFVRPLRFSLALFMAPVFDKFINWVQQRAQFKRQNAFAVYLFLLGSITSISVFGSIRLFAGPLAFATA
ncbi:TPA: hypothetical protein ACH3X2_011099 [Trebouxia sp. C0005]